MLFKKCKHEWVYITPKTQIKNDSKYESGKYKCIKCGKITKTI